MKKNLFLAALLMSLMFILAACSGSGSDSSEEASTDEGSEDGSGAEVSGNINEDDEQIAGEGSSTVFPILNLLVEDFNADHGVAVELGGNGTGSGFSALIEGTAQFANASRGIEQEEIDALEDAGIEWTEFLVATDGLTVAVNPANDFVEDLTFEELNMIYSGEAENWSDVREDFPEEPITAYGPDQSHGTHDFFNEEVMDEEGVDAQLIQDTNQVVSSVVGDENAIGFFGFSFYQANEDSLKAVSISGPDSEEAVEPTFENVMDFSYPLSRPLYMYVNNAALEENETFHTFMEYTLKNSQSAAEEVGYVPLEDEALEEELSKLPNLEQ
ncbi:Phosphate-binding protein PstS precursor [Jeotgalicoccus saudimassiliensis]|uniref:Phosphate-binding protein n=1 Tax=Jeotgalicoccus saudimassiliensis TaxID=1461582 RepID=A0A078M179_9STAP|nr:phosphate ABC transporter substrate-binding protein PstS family protein [Jeotgalicoccus saudimassiliensis]CEA00024.1 Phosphate-binding protein PstS precursor [Jeotgalicoccus saudimassiliensis]